MSQYTVTPTGKQQVSGVGWVEQGGTVAGGILGDGSTGTYITSAPWGGGYGAVWVDCANQTIPANEAATGAYCTIRPVNTDTISLSVVPTVRTGSAPFAQFGVGPALVVGKVSGAPVTTGTFVAFSRFLTQAEVNALGLYVKSTGYASVPSGWSSNVYEASLTIVTTSLVQAPAISALGTVANTSRPLIQWTHTDRTQATVSQKASSGTTRTITTSAAHGFAVGQSVSVSIGDTNYDTGSGVIASVTSTTFTYAGASSYTQSTTSASGTTWVGEDKAQTAARVVVFSSAQYGAANFDPDGYLTAGTYTWTTLINGADQAVTPDVDLANGTYRVYVRTASKTAGGITTTSPWSYVSMVLATVPSPAPTVTPVWDSTDCRVVLTVQGHANLLTSDDSTLEAATAAGWTVNANCSRTASTTLAKSGTYSLRLSSTASGNMSAYATGVAVTVGKSYSWSAYVRAGASARSSRVDVQWLDAANSVLSTTTGTAVTSATGSWTLIQGTGTAPTNAVTARLLVNVLSTGGASELHYFDELGVFPTSSLPSWTAGTGGSTYSVTVYRSLDQVTWTAVRVLPTDTAAASGGFLVGQDQYLACYDYEAPRGDSVYYQAQLVATLSGFSVASSLASAAVVTSIDGLSWLKAVNDPTLNYGFRALTFDGYGESRDSRAEVFAPAAGGSFVVNHPGGGWDRSLRIITSSTVEKEAWAALVATSDTVLLQMADVGSDGVGRQVYGSVTDNAQASPIVSANGMWEVTASLTETAP